MESPLGVEDGGGSGGGGVPGGGVGATRTSANNCCPGTNACAQVPWGDAAISAERMTLRSQARICMFLSLPAYAPSFNELNLSVVAPNDDAEYIDLLARRDG